MTIEDSPRTTPKGEIRNIHDSNTTIKRNSSIITNNC